MQMQNGPSGGDLGLDDFGLDDLGLVDLGEFKINSESSMEPNPRFMSTDGGLFDQISLGCNNIINGASDTYFHQFDGPDFESPFLFQNRNPHPRMMERRRYDEKINDLQNEVQALKRQRQDNCSSVVNTEWSHALLCACCGELWVVR
jgi:hypothetical protein